MFDRVLNMLLLLNMSRFWIYHGSKYTMDTQGYGYAGLCPNASKSVWMAFVLHLPIIPYLKEPQNVFLKSENLIIFYSSWKYLILLFVLDWIFLQVRFQICCYHLGAERAGGRESWYTQPMIHPINISMMLFQWLFNSMPRNTLERILWNFHLCDNE